MLNIFVILVNMSVLRIFCIKVEYINGAFRIHLAIEQSIYIFTYIRFVYSLIAMGGWFCTIPILLQALTHHLVLLKPTKVDIRMLAFVVYVHSVLLYMKCGPELP